MAWIAAIIGAVGAYASSQQQKKAAEKAGAPQDTSYSNLPYVSTRGHLDRYIDGFIRSQDAYRNGGPQFYEGPMPGGGQSQGTRDAIAGLEGFMDEGLGAAMQQFIQSQMGQPTDLMNRAFGAAEGYQPKYYDGMISGLSSGMLQQDPYLRQFIERGMAGGAARTANGGGVSGGSGGGGGAVGVDFDNIGLGDPTNQWMTDVLNGSFLNADNPHVAELLASIEREALETYQNSIVPQIDADFNRAGRFGSGSYALAQATANEEANEAIGGQKADVLNSNFQAERDRMAQALGLLNNLDISKINAAVDLAGQGTSASIAGANRSSQEALAREGMLLEAILGNAGLRMDGINTAATLTDSLYGRDNDRLSLMGQMASSDQDFQTNLLGRANENLGIEQQGLLAALQGRQSGDASRNANAWQRWNINNNRFERAQRWDIDSFLEGANFLSGIGSTFSEGHGRQPGQYVPYTSPAGAGLAGGLGAFGSAGGFDKGSGGGGGGGYASAADAYAAHGAPNYGF